MYYANYIPALCTIYVTIVTILMYMYSPAIASYTIIYYLFTNKGDLFKIYKLFFSLFASMVI